MSLTRMWTLIGAVSVILILLAGYAIGVAPALAAVDSANEEIATVELQNTVKSKELDDLKALSANSEQLFAKLADVQKSIPPTHKTSVFANQLSALAAAAGVLITEITYVSAADALSPDEASPPATPVEGAEEGDAAADADVPVVEEEPAAQSVPSVPGLVAIGVDINVEGSYAALHQFMELVQLNDRSFSVSKVGLQLGTSETEWEMTLSGAVYVLLDGQGTIAFSAGGGNVS